MKEKTAMEALDDGLEAADRKITDALDRSSAEVFDGSFDPPADDPDAMPVGHTQLDESAGSAAHWKFRRMAYGTTIVGLLLLPAALLVRTGRWSARILMAHDRGWEFGPW